MNIELRDLIAKIKNENLKGIMRNISRTLYDYVKSPFIFSERLRDCKELVCAICHMEEYIADLEKALEECTREPKVIAVDFDGTLCEDAYPGIGEPREDVITYLKGRKMKGDKLILWTCRVDDKLDEAVDWCIDQGLIFDAVNDNLPELVAKYGGNPRKVFADIYLDDRSFKVELED